MISVYNLKNIKSKRDKITKASSSFSFIIASCNSSYGQPTCIQSNALIVIHYQNVILILIVFGNDNTIFPKTKQQLFVFLLSLHLLIYTIQIVSLIVQIVKRIHSMKSCEYVCLHENEKRSNFLSVFVFTEYFPCPPGGSCCCRRVCIVVKAQRYSSECGVFLSLYFHSIEKK